MPFSDIIFQQEIKIPDIQNQTRESRNFTYTNRWDLASAVDLIPGSWWFGNWFASRGGMDVRLCVFDVGSRVQVSGYRFGKETPSWIRHGCPKRRYRFERESEERFKFEVSEWVERVIMIIFLFLLLFLDDETDFSIRIYLLDRYRILFLFSFFFWIKDPFLLLFLYSLLCGVYWI